MSPTLPQPPAQPLILASTSPVRALLLRNAGVKFTSEAPMIDEREMKAALRAENVPPGEAATALAELKARRVSNRNRGALVIGADQILECGGVWFDKPADLAQARADLLALRGRSHRLASAACAVVDGERVWHHVESAELVMRNFSDAFLDDYLAAAGPNALDAVGGYHLEGLGIQLFAQVRGDFFAILGLPLLPLLEFLRGRGAVPA